MTDIAERLREQAWQRSGAPKMDAGHTKMLEWEAADEIERLNQCVAELQAYFGYTESIQTLEVERLREFNTKLCAEIERLEAEVKRFIARY
jgi:hypothetical protein